MNPIVSERFQDVSQEVVFQTYGIYDKPTLEREAQSKVVVIKRQHTDNEFFNT